ncbi:hypothetical protein D9M71_213320 [compost metagenome]
MDSGGYLRIPWHLCAVPFRNVRLSTLRCGRCGGGADGQCLNFLDHSGAHFPQGCHHRERYRWRRTGYRRDLGDLRRRPAAGLYPARCCARLHGRLRLWGLFGCHEAYGCVGGAALHPTIVVLWQPVPADAGCGRWFRDRRAVAAGDRRAAGTGHAADNPGLLLHHQGHRVSQAFPSASAGADRATVRRAAGVCGAQ